MSASCPGKVCVTAFRIRWSHIFAVQSTEPASGMSTGQGRRKDVSLTRHKDALFFAHRDTHYIRCVVGENSCRLCPVNIPENAGGVARTCDDLECHDINRLRLQQSKAAQTVFRSRNLASERYPSWCPNSFSALSVTMLSYTET